MSEAETPFVRADALQRFTDRQRMQARMNIHAAKAPTAVQALVYGLDLIALTPLSPPDDILSDDNAILVTQTTLGNWSSDGNDTAPVSGPWLYLELLATTETVPAEFEEDADPPADISVDFRQWQVSFYEDAVLDTAFAWLSEKLQASLAPDIFAFRLWRPEPDLEDTTLEDDAVTTESTLWLQPLEPPLTIDSIQGLRAALDARLQYLGETPITDAAMTALGFTDQLQVTDGTTTWYLPISSTPWS